MDWKRIITGVLLGSGWLLLLITAPFALFAGVVVVLGVLGLREFAAIVLRKATTGARHILLCCGLLPLAGAFWGQPAAVAAGLVIALLVIFCFLVFTYSTHVDPFGVLLKLSFGVVYIGFLLGHMILIMAGDRGGIWLLFLSAVTVASDSGAYYSGRFFGVRKLCPAVSPGKSVAGLAGGLLAASVAGSGVALLFCPDFSPARAVPVAVLLALTGVAGDLLESILKRAHDVKDSGTLLPGHGGLLDRGDSILFSSPFLYYLLYFKVVP